MSMKLVAIGGGGHCKVVLSTALEMGVEVLAVLDDTTEKWNKEILGIPIIGPIDLFSQFDKATTAFVIAIGDNLTRKQISQKLKDVQWATLIHPRAYVHPSAVIDEGTVVFAGAIIQPYAKIGKHTIINTSVVVEHDCNVGSWVHLAPGVRLAGSATVKDGAFVGIGASVIPQKQIGKWSIVGAGSVVVKDIPDKCVAYGVPAKLKHTIDETINKKE